MVSTQPSIISRQKENSRPKGRPKLDPRAENTFGERDGFIYLYIGRAVDSNEVHYHMFNKTSSIFYLWDSNHFSVASCDLLVPTHRMWYGTSFVKLAKLTW